MPIEYVGRYIGQTDVPLSGKGIDQASSIGRFLRTLRFSSYRCSPMLRTMETGRIIAKETDGSISADDSLREIDFGSWEGLNFSEVSTRFPGDVREWLSAGDNFTFPGGESIRDFHERVAEATDRILKSGNRYQIVVTHGGVFRVMLCLLMDMPLRCASAFKIDYGATALIGIDDDCSSVGRLVYLNNEEVLHG